jgi:hypothetical protein
MPKTASNWFDVDRQGLAKLLEKKSKAFLIYELLQNAWDEKGVTRVDAELVVGKRGMAVLTVIDDAPEGFHDLSHAFTLFAESTKKGNPTQRGRFNFGEKLVLALCLEASITTTKGNVVFTPKGRKHYDNRTESGSTFTGILRMTKDEVYEVCREIESQLLPPAHIDTYFNGKLLATQTPLQSFGVALPTVIVDMEGNLTKTIRKTTIEIYDAGGGEAMLYEMGIPVCATGDKWHVDICQKVPLNMDRTGVTESYLRSVRVAVLNAMYKELEPEDATDTWVRDALGDKRAADAAVVRGIDLRFGAKRVVFDPSDPEANKLAVSKGYTVIQGGSLSKGEWENVKRTTAAKPAGHVTPSPKPYSESGDPAEFIPEKDWTNAQRVTVEYTKRLAEALLDGFVPEVMIVNTRNNFGAAYCANGELHWNVGRLGHKWFEAVARGDTDEFHRLLVHELGHSHIGDMDHLSSEYHDALCRLGAKLTRYALVKPGLFKIPA